MVIFFFRNLKRLSAKSIPIMKLTSEENASFFIHAFPSPYPVTIPMRTYALNDKRCMHGHPSPVQVAAPATVKGG